MDQEGSLGYLRERRVFRVLRLFRAERRLRPPPIYPVGGAAAVIFVLFLLRLLRLEDIPPVLVAPSILEEETPISKYVSVYLRERRLLRRDCFL